MPFKLLLAKRLWHGEKATSHTGLLWPVNVHTHAAEPSGSTRQSLIRLSLLHVAASEASELKAIEVAGNVWPVWMAVHARIVTQNFTLRDAGARTNCVWSNFKGEQRSRHAAAEGAPSHAM